MTLYTDRQGDVLLVRVESMPDELTDITPTDGRIVLKHGEATGHAHAFYSQPVRLYRTPTRERYLRVVETSYLRHEEHTVIDVPPGIYRLPEQVEHTDEDEPRIVAD